LGEKKGVCRRKHKNALVRPGSIGFLAMKFFGGYSEKGAAGRESGKKNHEREDPLDNCKQPAKK